MDVRSDNAFADASSEARRLEKKAVPKIKEKEFDRKLFDDLDVLNISIKSFEDAVRGARDIETTYYEPVHAGKPVERKEVIGRSKEEIAAEEAEIKKLKEKFAQKVEEETAPKKTIISEAREIAKKPAEKVEKVKEEEVKGVSEEFSAVTMKKEEREKRERIKRMKKEIDEMLKEDEEHA
jgi:hypothetical protein